MRKCTKCGNKLRDGERYCTVCGAPFWMAKPSFWSTRGAKILIAALCLVAAAGIGLAAWLLLRSPENDPSKTAESEGGIAQSSESGTAQSSEAPQTLPEKTTEAKTSEPEASSESIPVTETTRETQESSSERSNEPIANTEAEPQTTAAAPEPQTTAVDGKALVRGVVDASDSQDIKWIINRFREVSDHLDRFDSETFADGSRYYEKGTRDLVCVQLRRNNVYEEYYYDNGQLFFADYYYEWGTWRGLTRFYYKDGSIIRYAEQDNGPTHDYPEGLDPVIFAQYSGERDLFTSGMRELQAAE